MTFYINEKFINYEAGNIFRIFFPYTELKLTNELTENPEISLVLQEDFFTLKINFDNVDVDKKYDLPTDIKEKEYVVCREIFNEFSKITSYLPKWGMLTGIHPVKLFASFKTDENKKKFQDDYLISDEKIELCKTIVDVQKKYIDDIGENDFSLYVSIPFCPTRCNYCSFVSQSVEKTDKLIGPYVDLLLKEIEHTAKVSKKNKLILKSVYFGGGTPTTLNSEQLTVLINCIKANFDMTNCVEFTVEAGRPDTITLEKLEILKSLGVQRISINPQTFNDQVLENIGRKHSAKDAIDKFIMANNVGFDSINMDLIAGLQGDTYESFVQTIEKVLQLAPSNITVHSLALKRSAEIFQKAETKSYHSQKDEVTKMIDYSIKRLFEEGYKPYYLYRQSRMAGNAENTGWTKDGKECAYNIYTMDESQTVLACGAGGVSKLKDPYSTRLERIFNFKYSYEYLDRFDEILKRKDEVTNLYEQFRKWVH